MNSFQESKHSNAIASLADATRAAVAADLLILADLHDHTLQREAIVALWSRCYDGLFALSPCSLTLRKAMGALCQSLTEIPTCFDAATDAALVADYQQIYLGIGTLSGPRRSAWVKVSTDTRAIDSNALHLWGEQRGEPIGRWISDDDADHLVTQLRYLACLVAADGMALPSARLAPFLDQHLLLWIDRFASEVANHGTTHLYRELAALTAVYLHELATLFEHGHAYTAASQLTGKRHSHIEACRG